MEKNAVPPKTKPPPTESSEETGSSSSEETEDEEQAEGRSVSESGSDESMGASKKKLISILPSRQQPTAKAAAPAAAPDSPVKRTRESNGKKDKVDEPPNKKKKNEVTTPAPRSAPKPTAQQSEKKSANRTERVKLTPTVKEKLSAEKKSATKRKNTSPVLKTSALSRSENETPQKSRPWSSDEELTLSRALQRDRVNNAYGSTLPSARSDPYWAMLMSRLPFMEKYEEDYRIERLCEKVRRMRIRYESLNARIQAGETSVYKNPHEGILWRIWRTIWGPHKATPRMLNGEDAEEDNEEEEVGSDEEGSEEDDEEEIVPTQVKGHQASGRNKPISKKVVADEPSSDDDESNEDDSPVKATPPAALAAAAAAVPAIPGAGKQAPVSKSVPTKGPAVSAMDVDSGRNASRVGVHNGAQGGHASIPAMIEKSVRADALPKVSDEMRAENLALLRDMRGTCVKMVEEAKAQSLLITERILEETRVNTTKIVEEARVKCSQVMEELRFVVERLSTVSGQSGQRNGSHGGRWSVLSDNPHRGMVLFGDLPLDDPNYVKCREHDIAVQSAWIQWLQVEQDGIRLNLSILENQASAQGKQA